MARYRGVILTLAILLGTVTVSLAALVWGWVNGAMVGDSQGYLGYALCILVLITGVLLAAAL